MSSDAPSVWTLEQHLAAGAIALARINADAVHAGPEPVCHHFYEVNPVDPAEVSIAATYAHLVPRFRALGLEFAADRLEAWEVVKPNSEWIKDRIPALMDAAVRWRLHYQGWTWEPRDRQPIAASQVLVINNRSD